jgi:hypothetical protein
MMWTDVIEPWPIKGLKKDLQPCGLLTTMQPHKVVHQPNPHSTEHFIIFVKPDEVSTPHRPSHRTADQPSQTQHKRFKEGGEHLTPPFATLRSMQTFGADT